MRTAWFISSIIIAALLAYASFDAALDIVTNIFGLRSTSPLYRLITRSELIEIAGIFSLFAVYLAILQIFLAGLVDAIKCNGVINLLAELADRKAAGKPVTRKLFLEIFDSQGLLEQAADHFITQFDINENVGKKKETAQELSVARTPSSQSFAPSVLLDNALFFWLFRPLPLAVIGVSTVCFLLALVGSNDAVVADDLSSPFYQNLRTGIVALAFGLASATFVEALTAMIGAYRRAQIQQLTHHIDSLFIFGTEQDYLARLIENSDAHAKKITQGVVKLAESTCTAIEKSGKSVIKAVEDANENTASRITKSISDALVVPMKNLTASTKALTRDQGMQVKKLLDTTLKDFTTELARHLGGQVKEISGFLKMAGDASAKAEKSFSSANTMIAKQTEEQLKSLNISFKNALKSLSQFEERNHKALTTDLDGLVKALNAEVSSHSREFGKLVEKGLKDVQATAEATLSDSSAELQTAAGSLDGLRDQIENLTTFVTPILRQVLDNQESLFTALESDASSSKAIGRAANQMNAASQASRETVERFITLAEQMREISRTLKSDGLARPRNQPAKGRSDELSKALRDLKGSAKDLPEL